MKILRTAFLSQIEPGDTVRRMLAGTIPCDLVVQKIENGIIDCGWTFDLKTGAEIDDDLGWGPPPKVTGSYLSEIVKKANGNKAI